MKSGDNLSKIAKRSGVSVEELRKANPKLKGDMLHPGDKLNIPTKGKAAKQSRKTAKKAKEDKQARLPAFCGMQGVAKAGFFRL